MTRRALAVLLLALGCDPQRADTATQACGSRGELALVGSEIELEAGGCASLVLEPRAVGEGELAVSLVLEGNAVMVTVAAGEGGATLRALSLEGQVEIGGTEPLRWWRQGYQSWSWAGVLEASEVTLDGEALPKVGGAGVTTSFLQDTASSSWWAGLLGRADGASVLVGVLSADSVPFYTAASDSGEFWGVWGGFDEVYELAPGEMLELPPVWLAVDDDAHELWTRYAEAVSGHTAPRELPVLDTVGWSSWYSYYAEVTEEDVRSNLRVVAELNASGEHAPVGLVQVDDGWQQMWGEWTANEKFPAGMAALASDIQAAGLQPGLWMAPFYVSRESAAYLEHDDWWVLDGAGAELAFGNDGTGDYAVIDVTHPDASAWLEGVIAARVAEGWTYLKLDFLYAGAQPGLRYHQVSGLEAYARGLEVLRQGAGEGTFILACGAPMLPSVGFADGYRTGADIAYGWDPDPEPAYLRWQARATAGRAWMNGRWWWNDPDVLMVREPYDDVLARGAVVAQLVSGGLWLAGDDLGALTDAQLALELSREAIPLRGQEVRPFAALRYPSGHDLGPVAERQVPDDRVPLVWRVGPRSTALLNLGDGEVVLASPGGRELLTGAAGVEGEPRTLAPGEGEIWLADE